MKERVTRWLFSNLANLITTARLIMSGYLIIWAFFGGNKILIIFFLILLCSISDAVDGWLARKYCIISEVGGFLDRLADKIFICAAILILNEWNWSANIMPTIKFLTASLVIVIVLLEVILLSSGVIALLKGLGTSANQWGKRKMICYSIAVNIWIFSLVVENYFKIEMVRFSILLIDVILMAAIFLAIKSIEGYWQRYYQKKNI